VLRDTLLLALPVSAAAAALNLLIYPEGTTTLLVLGPFRVTAEGAQVAGLTVLRVLAIAAVGSAFVRSTRPDALVADLEARGVPARLLFPLAAAATLLPATADRVRAIAAAQRMRGLDTEGSLRARLRGIVPIALPTLLGVLDEVEGRTLALASRGFGRPGRRTLLWRPAEAGVERAIRPLLVLGVLVVLLLRAGGVSFP